MGWLTGPKHKALNDAKIQIVVDFNYECFNHNPKHPVSFPAILVILVIPACGWEVTFHGAHMKKYDEIKHIFFCIQQRTGI